MEPELSQPNVLMAAVIAAAVVVVLAGLAALRRPSARAGAVRVAHTERLRALPSYRRAVRRRRLGLGLVSVLLLAGIGVAGYVAARPMVMQTRQSHLNNRDIVLCLDVSSSMNAQDLAIVQTFRQLVAGLEGERIALVLFDSMPLVIFPLTDDYDLIRTRLEATEKSMNGTGPDLTVGTTDGSLGTSLVGDGLMGCAELFTADAALAQLRAAQPGAAQAGGAPAAEPATAKRSRVLILATDNQEAARTGGPLFTVAQAAERARGFGAIVVALDANRNPNARSAAELAAAAALTGGATYSTGGGSAAVEQITAIVQNLDSRTIDGDPVNSTFDVPGRALGVLLPLMVALVLAWRVVRP